MGSPPCARNKDALSQASEEIQRAIESRDNEAFTKAVKSYCASLKEEEQGKEKLGRIPADVQNRRLEMFKIAGGSSNTVILINPSSLSKKLDDVILKLDGRKLIKVRCA